MIVKPYYANFLIENLEKSTRVLLRGAEESTSQLTRTRIEKDSRTIFSRKTLAISLYKIKREYILGFYN